MCVLDYHLLVLHWLCANVFEPASLNDAAYAIHTCSLRMHICLLGYPWAFSIVSCHAM